MNLEPIIVNLVTTNETENNLDGPFGTELANFCWQSQHLFILSLSGIPLCILGHTLKANLHVFHRGTRIFLSNTFTKISYYLSFKLVLQINFHGLSYTVVRLF